MRKRKRKSPHLPIQRMTLKQFERRFPDEDACRAFLCRRRWPKMVRCPRCGHDKVYRLEHRPWHWQCHHCSDRGYRFSVLVGTIFENANVSLRDWFRVIHLMLTSEKDVSALHMFRYMGFGSYKTAWLMRRKVMEALGTREFQRLIT